MCWFVAFGAQNFDGFKLSESALETSPSSSTLYILSAESHLVFMRQRIQVLQHKSRLTYIKTVIVQRLSGQARPSQVKPSRMRTLYTLVYMIAMSSRNPCPPEEGLQHTGSKELLHILRMDKLRMVRGFLMVYFNHAELALRR